MKNIIYIITLLAFYTASAQVRMTSTSVSATNSSAFIDASSNNLNNTSTGVGKGLVFPRVDLSTFTFVGTTGIASNFPSRFDGMIVYNTKDGGTANAGTTQGTLAPGFWFYENKSNTVTGGTWKALGSGASAASKDITSTEIELPIKINGEQLYAINGTFTASGTTALITVAKPAGMTGYYSFTSYKDGNTFRKSISSFDISKDSDNVVTGNGLFIEPYPAGTYSFVLEYFK